MRIHEGFADSYAPLQRDLVQSQSMVALQPWLPYVQLWRTMLSPQRQPDVDFPDAFHQEVSAIVYDELMRAILKMLRVRARTCAVTTSPHI